MEAALPISAAPDVRVAQPKQVRATAPSVSLPLRFIFELLRLRLPTAAD